LPYVVIVTNTPVTDAAEIKANDIARRHEVTVEASSTRSQVFIKPQEEDDLEGLQRVLCAAGALGDANWRPDIGA